MVLVAAMATRLIDVNSTPYSELEKLPEFIQKKMHSSEEWELRQNFDRGKVTDFRPKSVTGEEDATPF
jgi:hypothetical protein